MEGKYTWSSVKHISGHSELILGWRKTCLDLAWDATQRLHSADRIKIKIKRFFLANLEHKNQIAPAFAANFPPTERLLSFPPLLRAQTEISPVVRGCCLKRHAESRWTCVAATCLSHRKQAFVCSRTFLCICMGWFGFACPDVHQGLDAVSWTCSLVSTCHSSFTGAGLEETRTARFRARSSRSVFNLLTV